MDRYEAPRSKSSASALSVAPAPPYFDRTTARNLPTRKWRPVTCADDVSATINSHSERSSETEVLVAAPGCDD